MFSFRSSAANLFLLSLLLSCSASSPNLKFSYEPLPQRIAIRAARMLDVDQGKMISDPVVMVEGERIISVASGVGVPYGVKVIDLGDATILPGLIDAHTHITYHFDENGMFGRSGDPSPEVTLKYSEENARRTLKAGFTTIRNLGAGQRVDIVLRDEIKSGQTEGPRMLVSGLPLTPDILRGANKAERIGIIRQFVSARIKEGVDVIKIFEGVDGQGQPLLSSVEIRAAVDVAKQAGLKVAAHAHEAAAMIAAITGGCDSIEHGTFANDEARRLMVKNHIALVPTVYLPTHYLSHKKQFAFDVSTWTFFEMLKNENLENTRRAKRSGVWIVDGSDAVAGLHGENARELEWLNKAGLTPAEAIHAATLDAAELLGLKGQVGDIKEGYLADIIAVPGDPLKDISVLERVAFVMKSGRVFKSKL